MGTPSISTQALIAARALLELFPPELVAVTVLNVQRTDSIDKMAETAPPFDVFSAAGMSNRTTSELVPPLMDASTMQPSGAFTSCALQPCDPKKALFEAAFCAKATPTVANTSTTARHIIRRMIPSLDEGRSDRAPVPARKTTAPEGNVRPPPVARLSSGPLDPWLCGPVSRRVCPYREGSS